MYSVPEATEEVVDAFSQSFSPLRLPQRLGDKKPSMDSDLNRRDTVFLCPPTEKGRLGASRVYVAAPTRVTPDVPERETVPTPSRCHGCASERRGCGPCPRGTGVTRRQRDLTPA